MQNSNFSTWITSLYGSQPSSEVFACKPAAFGQKLHVSMCPSTHPWFSAYKTACLASELLVSMNPSPHLWFCMQNSDFWTRITNLYGSQTSLVVLCMQYSVISTRITCLYGSQPSSVVFACKTAWLASESLVSMGPSPHVWFLDAKQRLFDRYNKSLWVPDITCNFVPGKQHL